MKLAELEGARVKLSAGTITVKDENGKTHGMIRGLRRFNTWSLREKFDTRQALTASGIWGCGIDGLIDNLYLDGTNIIYINNLQPLDAFHLLDESFFNYDRELARYNKRVEIAENAAKYMTVVNCYILL